MIVLNKSILFVSFSGTPPLLSQTMITFKIINPNLYAPVCDMKTKHIKWSIMENSPLGTLVGNLTCFDRDQDEFNGRLAIDIVWTDSDTIPFDISMKTTDHSQVKFAFEIICIYVAVFFFFSCLVKTLVNLLS